MTAEAKSIYEALPKHGPLDTIRLRREARMSAESAKSRFDRALIELQVEFKVLPIGVVRTSAWNYEIVQRHYPDLPEQAQQIKRSKARRTLVLRYLDNVIATDRKMIGKVFHILKWTSSELDRTIQALLQEGAIQETQIEGINQPQLVSACALEHTP
ncbi:MAG: hypothetical protein GY832_44290 [Chloroflexi bacterium]|nr:hypothetical protein [Chloroflexota bacterium]